MEAQLSLEFLRVVENAAIAAARTMGVGDRHKADEVAVEAMRKTMDAVQMDGTIVIGEGERDEAPMLYIGEKVGLATARAEGAFPKSISPSIRWKAPISAPPARRTRSRCWPPAKAAACCTRPICTWKKLSSGPSCKGAVDLDAPVADNLKSSRSAWIATWKIWSIIVLDRPRHEKLIADIRKAGARIRLIGDGDLSAGISAAVVGTGVHAVMGTGGAPEGVHHRRRHCAA